MNDLCVRGILTLFHSIPNIQLARKYKIARTLTFSTEILYYRVKLRPISRKIGNMIFSIFDFPFFYGKLWAMGQYMFWCLFGKNCKNNWQRFLFFIFCKRMSRSVSDLLIFDSENNCAPALFLS